MIRLSFVCWKQPLTIMGLESLFSVDNSTCISIPIGVEWNTP